MPRATRPPKKTHTRLYVSLIVLLAVAFALIWAARSIQTALVPSMSMQPTLQTGDFLLVRKDAYTKGRTPQRGDIVLFKRNGVSNYFVKRVVGLPGESIIVDSGYVRINDQWLQEPYLGGETIREWPGYLHLGNDEYFLMGDNRANSEDSRDTGAVNMVHITGKVVAIIAPRHRRTRILNPFAE